MTQYASVNFDSKKKFKEAVANGDKIRVKNISPMGETLVENEKCCVSGPWYPKPHKWYAEVVVKDGFVISVK